VPRTRGWVFTPDRGGTPIPEPVRRRTQERIRRYAAQQFAGCYTRLEIRFHGQFCYIDAYTEPAPLSDDWPPTDWPETREEYLERLRHPDQAVPPALFRRRGPLGLRLLHLQQRAVRALGVPVG